MTDDLMHYEDMAREALRGVVREALRRTADEGLPGSHHFYITFDTQAPGVDLDDDLFEKHPEEMTIVLEHQYWDLAVDEDAFEVTLKFNRIPKYIRIPFDAVTQFHDPSVNFTLRFQASPSDLHRRSRALSKKRRAAKARAADADAAPDAAHAAPAGAGGQIVSLDAFRKKSDS